MSKIYKWVPIDIVSKILRYGLSFSPASNFKDVAEYTIQYKAHTIEGLERFLIRFGQDNNCLQEKIALAKKIKNDRELQSELLKELEAKKNEFPCELKKALNDRYYVCSTTYDESTNFKWSDSDDNKVNWVRLTLNRKEVEKQYRRLCRDVQYHDKRPKVNQTSSLEECVYDIVFSKLKRDATSNYNYEEEKEVRLLLCTERLNVPVEKESLKRLDGEKYIYDLHLHDYLEEISLRKEANESYSQEWEKILCEKQETDHQIELYNRLLDVRKHLPSNPPPKGHMLLNFDEMTDEEKAFFIYFTGLEHFSTMHTKNVVAEIFESFLAKGLPVSDELLSLFESPRYNNVPINRV